jgi:hypothetical protein
VASKADLSMLDDFGVIDITDNLDGFHGRDLAGLLQSGDGNRASIAQQSRGSNNIAQIWQHGDGNFASVSQEGDFNATRLWQGGEGGHSATLVQRGSDNHIAAVQYGSGSLLSGTQDGVGNQAAVVLMGGSNFTFSQHGNNNSIAWDVASNITMSITQIGNDMRTSAASP